MMPREAAFFKRTSQIYGAMKTRMGPKYWKAGPHKGALRVVGIKLPFDLDQFQVWYQAQLGGTVDGICKCAYCPRFITAIDAQVDHVHPTKQGGSPGLENLTLCCGECNRYKGSLTLPAFNAIKRFLELAIQPQAYISWLNATKDQAAPMTITDAADIERRLKGGLVYRKTKNANIKAKKKADEDDDF